MPAPQQRGPWPDVADPHAGSGVEPRSGCVSGAYLTEPEWVEPFEDVIRYTASIAHTTTDGRVASLLAWGQNREVHGVLDAYLFETTARLTSRDTAYTRAELVAKNILGAGARHVAGIRHFHPISRVGALTLGDVRDVRVAAEGRWGVGGDVTVYHVPENLRFNRGSPASFHLFLRYRPARAASHQH